MRWLLSGVDWNRRGNFRQCFSQYLLSWSLFAVVQQSTSLNKKERERQSSSAAYNDNVLLRFFYCYNNNLQEVWISHEDRSHKRCVPSSIRNSCTCRVYAVRTLGERKPQVKILVLAAGEWITRPKIVARTPSSGSWLGLHSQPTHRLSSFGRSWYTMNYDGVLKISYSRGNPMQEQNVGVHLSCHLCTYNGGFLFLRYGRTS